MVSTNCYMFCWFYIELYIIWTVQMVICIEFNNFRIGGHVEKILSHNNCKMKKINKK